jgi:hypothetical protein
MHILSLSAFKIAARPKSGESEEKKGTERSLFKRSGQIEDWSVGYSPFFFV